MLQLVLLFALSFGSVGAVADVAVPAEREVFSQVAALAVERLSPAEMQESEGAYLAPSYGFSSYGLFNIDWSRLRIQLPLDFRPNPDLKRVPKPEPEKEKPKPSFYSGSPLRGTPNRGGMYSTSWSYQPTSRPAYRTSVWERPCSPWDSWCS